MALPRQPRIGRDPARARDQLVLHRPGRGSRGGALRHPPPPAGKVGSRIRAPAGDAPGASSRKAVARSSGSSYPSMSRRARFTRTNRPSSPWRAIPDAEWSKAPRNRASLSRRAASARWPSVRSRRMRAYVVWPSRMALDTLTSVGNWPPVRRRPTSSRRPGWAASSRSEGRRLEPTAEGSRTSMDWPTISLAAWPKIRSAPRLTSSTRCAWLTTIRASASTSSRGATRASSPRRATSARSTAAWRAASVSVRASTVPAIPPT